MFKDKKRYFNIISKHKLILYLNIKYLLSKDLLKKDNFKNIFLEKFIQMNTWSLF